MSIINLNNLNFNKEKTRLSPSRKFIYKNDLCTDVNLEYFEFEKSNIDKISFDNENYFGALPVDAYQTKNIKELGGTTKRYVQNLPIKENYPANTYNPFLAVTPLDDSKPAFPFTINIQGEKLKFFQTRYFGIKRSQQELRPLSKINEKKKIIRNLYEYSKSQGDAGYNQSFNYGFLNYNCLNFFNILPSSLITDQKYRNKLIQTTHQCGLIYSNRIINNKNVFPGNNKMSISFWINPKRLASIGYNYNPGCILHIPNVISIWLIENDSIVNEQNQSLEFYLQVQLESDANNYPRQSNNGFTFIGTSYSLKLNHWHNIIVNFSKNILFAYVDDNQVINENNLNLDFGTNFESIFSIGNKVNSYDFSKSLYDIDNCRKYFFNQYSLIEQSLNENEVIKITETENEINIEREDLDLFSKKIYPVSTSNIFSVDDESSALNAELHNLVIFNDFINFEEIKEFSKGKLDLLKVQSVSFYLPCVYIPEKLYRKGYITIGEVGDLCYNSCVNPVFAHKIYGHELSVEHFVKDIIGGRRPYILGMKPITYKDKFSNFENDAFIKGKIVENYFSKHKTVNQTINTHFLNGEIFINDDFVIDDFLKNNLIYRNNFILPCDNGLCNLDLSSTVSLQEYSKRFINKELKNVNLKSLFFDETKYNYDKPINFFKSFIVFDTLKNFNTSNADADMRSIIPENYFNKIILEKNDDKFSIQKFMYDYMTNLPRYQIKEDKLNYLKSKSKKWITNSIFKIIDNETLETSDVLELRTFSKIKDTNGLDFQIASKNYYKKYNSHVSIEGEDTETHSIIFDVSNALYSERIRKGHFSLKDIDIAGTGGALRINLKDNNGLLYRADCLTPHAKWNYVGHIFYRDGLATIMHPGLYSFGENNFACELKGDHSLHTFEVNIPLEKGDLNYSLNKTYKKLRPSSGLYDTDEEGFVYITGVNLHDENLNIVARANFAQPIVKRQNDRYNVRLKMDY